VCRSIQRAVQGNGSTRQLVWCAIYTDVSVQGSRRKFLRSCMHICIQAFLCPATSIEFGPPNFIPEQLLPTIHAGPWKKKRRLPAPRRAAARDRLSIAAYLDTTSHPLLATYDRNGWLFPSLAQACQPALHAQGPPSSCVILLTMAYARWRA
jgi:hypothetical protein